MDDKQLLDAIQSIVQKETSILREEMETRFTQQSVEMDSRFGAVETQLGTLESRFDTMESQFTKQAEELEAQFASIDARFTSLEARIDRQSSENKTLHENTFDRIKNLLHEDYERVAGAAAKGAAVAESHHELQSTVNTHEKVLQSHNDRLSVLEEKAI